VGTDVTGSTGNQNLSWNHGYELNCNRTAAQ
jgi:hypothetical protein